MAALPTKMPHVFVDAPESESTFADDLLFRLVGKLSDSGLAEMATMVMNAEDLKSAVKSLLREGVLVVLDEFQRAMTSSGAPVPAVRGLLGEVGGLVAPPGRLLMLSNRRVDRTQWPSGCEMRILSKLEPEVAVEFLKKLLMEDCTTGEIPEDQMLDVANWLGCNPRALQALVACLATASLDEIILEQKPSWEERDKEASQELIEKLETGFLDRVINKISTEAQDLLVTLSVHRVPFRAKVIELAVGNSEEAKIRRKELADRFLIEHNLEWWSSNPVAKDKTQPNQKQT